MKIWSQFEFPLLRHHLLLAVAALAGRLVLALAFLYAGALKAADPIAFTEDVRSFQMLGDPWAAWLAMGLPWLEIFCALALILGGWTRGALLVLGGLLLVFATAFIQAWARDLDVTCGCFGKTENKTNFAQSLGIDFGLLAVVACAWMARTRLRRYAAKREHSGQAGGW